MSNKTTRILSEVEIDREDDGLEPGVVFMVTSIFYQKGGISYVSYTREPRGYYLSVRTEKRMARNGYSIVSFELFVGGIKLLIEEAKMFSAKKLAALEVDPELVTRLTQKVAFERQTRIAIRAEQRAARLQSA